MIQWFLVYTFRYVYWPMKYILKETLMFWMLIIGQKNHANVYFIAGMDRYLFHHYKYFVTGNHNVEEKKYSKIINVNFHYHMHTKSWTILAKKKLHHRCLAIPKICMWEPQESLQLKEIRIFVETKSQNLSNALEYLHERKIFSRYIMKVVVVDSQNLQLISQISQENRPSGLQL